MPQDAPMAPLRAQETPEEDSFMVVEELPPLPAGGRVHGELAPHCLGRCDLFRESETTLNYERELRRQQAKYLEEQIQERKQRKEQEARQRAEDDAREDRRLMRERRELEERHARESTQRKLAEATVPGVPPVAAPLAPGRRPRPRPEIPEIGKSQSSPWIAASLVPTGTE